MVRIAVSGSHRTGKSTLLSHPPSLEDLEAQLDRCPVDVLAYVAVHEEAEEFDWEAWLSRVREASVRAERAWHLRERGAAPEAGVSFEVGRLRYDGAPLHRPGGPDRG
jgi:hypothetical protein